MVIPKTACNPLADVTYMIFCVRLKFIRYFLRKSFFFGRTYFLRLNCCNPICFHHGQFLRRHLSSISMRNRIDNDDYCIISDENISVMKTETFHHYFVGNVSHFDSDEQLLGSNAQLIQRFGSVSTNFRLISNNVDACARAAQER